METDGIFDGKIAPKFLKILEIMIIEIHSHTLTAKNPRGARHSVSIVIV